jgi:lysozyme
MKPRHKVSRAAIELIKRFEGYRRNAAQLPDGRWTIGYGHTLTARQGAQVSEDDAEALLIYDLIAVAHVVNEQTYAPLTQNQFDALCAFAFNIGLDAFRGSSVVKRINEGDLVQAAFGMELWRKADFQGERIVIDALVRRRAAEKALFLTPPGGAWIAAPSAILRPALDIGAPDLSPATTPALVTTTLEGERVLVLRDGEPTPAPSAPEEPEPVRAAAAEVAARLQTIFQEQVPAEEEPESQPEAGPEGDERRPQADFAPPIDLPHDSADIGEPDTVLVSPSSGPETASPGDEASEAVIPPAPAPANDAGVEVDADVAPSAIGEAIGDGAPFAYVPPQARASTAARGGLLGEILLALLGLVFFGGGIFWALAARASVGSMRVDPLLVGLLAGLAGVGFFVSAVFLLLQRLGRHSEGRKPGG